MEYNHHENVSVHESVAASVANPSLQFSDNISTSCALAKPPSISTRRDTANDLGSMSLPMQFPKPPPPSAGNVALVGGELLTSTKMNKAVAHAANPHYENVIATKKHPYNLHVNCPSSGHIISHPLKKGGLLHGQIIILVSHVIDVSDIAQFWTAMETIKTSTGQFPDTIPFSV